MTRAPAATFFRRASRRPRPARHERPAGPTAWSPAGVRPVEIVAPDRYCTTVLLEYAGPLFAAEIVPGDGWVVRLQPPAEPGWVLELLVLVERWLEYVRLPCAKVLYGGRNYLIRSSTDVAQLMTATEPAPAVFSEVLD